MQTGPVLFVTYGGGHISMVLPVVQALQRRGIACEVLALTTAYKPALQAGLAPRGYRDFLHLVDREAVLARGSTLSAGNLHPEVDALETQSYLGINYSEWIDTYGQQEAARKLAEGGRRAFFPIRFMGRVLDELRPAILVTTNSPRSEQAAIEAAVARSIPSLSMIDLFALDTDPYLKRTVHADRITVLAPLVRQRLVAAGIPEDRIRVTGNPAFDALVQPGNQQRADALRQALGWQNLNVVLWAGHLEDGADVPAEWRREKFGVLIEQQLRAWVAGRSDVALIVRYHPNDLPEFPVQPPQERVHVSDPRQEPLYAALLASDAVVVQTTTVGVEGAVAGRHVFALSFSPLVRASGMDYSVMGLAHSVATPQDLVPLLEQHAVQPVKAAGRFNAGHAAQEVADEIALVMSAARPAGPRTAPSRA